MMVFDVWEFWEGFYFLIGSKDNPRFLSILAVEKLAPAKSRLLSVEAGSILKDTFSSKA